MKILCIIPARGGSKGIFKKNIVNFVSEPLICHSIKQAKKSKYIENVIVSSDSEEILDISKKYGAEVLKRPKHLSTDTCTSESALMHAIDNVGAGYTHFVFLQATSPLRTTEDIDKCIEKLISENYDSLFSATVMEDMLIWKKSGENLDSLNYDFKRRKRRQETDDQFLENGSIYVFEKKGFLENKNRLFGKIGLSLMSSWKMFEIDSTEDLELCEIIYQKKLL